MGSDPLPSRAAPAASEASPSLEALWASHAGGHAAADAVYATLREAIMVGAVRAGDRLGEQHLGRQFRVSRTPVREALHRLEVEQFATRIPRGGLVVRTVTQEEVLEVYAVRVALDGLAAALAAQHGLPADRVRLRWINERLSVAADTGDSLAMKESNVAFHEALYEASHNRMLLGFVRQVHDWVSRFRETTFSYPGRAQAAVVEHRQVLDAIEAGDAEAAAAAARNHMSNALQVRIAMFH